MNKISAKIIADSKSPYGERITTMVVTFPRIVLSEFNTHRMFSRNSASSRAIPFKKMVKMVEDDPFVPIAWQKEHSGMQGSEYFEPHKDAPGNCADMWLRARDNAIKEATALNVYGVTKQLCNRPLESFMWHTAIVTSTEWENFFELRCPKYTFSQDIKDIRSRKEVLKLVEEKYKRENIDLSIIDEIKKEPDLWWLKINEGGAEIHISLLAEAMYDALNESAPKELQEHEWHIPFGDQIDEERLGHIFNATGEGEDIQFDSFTDMKIKIATARCARVSYINYEGKDDYEADLKLFNILTKNGHASPLEHCAKTMSLEETEQFVKTYYSDDENKIIVETGWCRNFRGFIQLRAMID